MTTIPKVRLHRLCTIIIVVSANLQKVLFQRQPVRHDAWHQCIATGVLWDLRLGQYVVIAIKAAVGEGLIAALPQNCHFQLINLLDSDVCVAFAFVKQFILILVMHLDYYWACSSCGQLLVKMVWYGYVVCLFYSMSQLKCQVLFFPGKYN